jgi:hypothetical protein
MAGCSLRVRSLCKIVLPFLRNSEQQAKELIWLMSGLLNIDPRRKFFFESSVHHILKDFGPLGVLTEVMAE